MSVAKIYLQRLNASNLASIVSISNKNFETIQNNLNGFWEDVEYDADAGSMTIAKLNASSLTLDQRIDLIVNNNTMFTLDSNGNMSVRVIEAEHAEFDRLVLNEDTGVLSNPGILGQVAFTGADFVGYTPDGWKSFTAGTGGSSGTDGSYSNKMDVTLLNNSAGSVALGQTGSEVQINVMYFLNRGSKYESGMLYILHNEATAELLHEYQRMGGDSGVTFTVSINAFNEILLNYVVTDNVDDVDMSYIMQVILA